MCARLLACPLCSQPRFLTLDALRAGLVSVATRPLVCPVCNEVLLGIDKLTIHLFGHTINLNNNAMVESSKHEDVVVAPDEHAVAVHNAHNIAQDWIAFKGQRSDKSQITDNRTCTDLPDSEVSTVRNETSTVNSQPQTQTRDSSIEDTCQRISVADYNYDVIRINILSQSSPERCNVTSRPARDLRQVPKTKCASRFSRDDGVEYLDRENTQTINTAVSDFSNSWTEKHGSREPLATTQVAETVDIYQDMTEIETESNDNRHVTKERPMLNLMDKESGLSDFRSMQNAIQPVCADNAPSEKLNDERSLRDAKETVLEANAENRQEHRSSQDDYRRILRTKIFQTAASKEKSERCNICGFHFSDANILALHQQLVHEQDLNNITGKILKNYSCHLCSKVFKMRGSLMVHMRVAHIGHNLGSLSKDEQTELTQNGDAGYNCPTCGKRFKKEQHVIQHLKTHEGKQWECDVCSKMFTTKYFLKKHKRLHSGEMPYKCKICDKNFTFQQSYHKHRLYHKDDKPHTCATCGRSFKELSTLHNHERIHTGEKPFACETCGKCFRQRVSYLVHRRIHTGVMPYKCAMCGKSFRYKVSQRTHKCPAQVSGNKQQLSDATAQEANDNIAGLQTTNLPQEDQSTINTVDNEENKFVLIINAQGQHILASQSKVNMCFERNEQMEFGDATNVDADSGNKTWNTKNLNSEELEESTESIKIQTDSEGIKDTNDLFSLMSRFENNMSSPTFQMEHLRVSSPKAKENSIGPYIDFPQIISDNAQMNTERPNVEQNLTRDKDVSDSLQTINVESLKELLYGMDKK